MNLEQLIDEVYGKYQADLKAKADAKKLQEQQEIEQAIAAFRSDFDEMISSDLQKELGIQICAILQKPVYVCAKFVYMGENLKISRWCFEDWRLEINDSFSCGDKPDVFLNLLLVELGKIKAYVKLDEPIRMTPLEILQKFNQYYVEIEAIALSEEWQELCKAKHDDPEMKTHLGDVLHYLGEAIDCLDNPTIPTIITKLEG
ncbi:hypothetical protein [Nostoc sp.]